MTTCGRCGTLGHNARTCKAESPRRPFGGTSPVVSVPSSPRSALGFSVMATVTHVVYETAVDGMLQVCYGLDPNGYEIVWTFHMQPPSVGDHVDVRGASIIRYSGEDGPWDRTAEPQKRNEA